MNLLTRGVQALARVSAGVRTKCHWTACPACDIVSQACAGVLVLSFFALSRGVYLNLLKY